MLGPQTAPTLIDDSRTPVVRLRPHQFEDAIRVVEQSVDPLSRAWTTVPLDYSLDDARRFVGEIMPGGWLTDREWGFAIEVDGVYAGTCSLRNEGADRAEIAYGAHPDVRGTRAVERALRLLLEWGFIEQGLRTVVWWADRGNWASRKVAWRLGFSLDGTLPAWLPQRGELVDAWVGTLRRDAAREPSTRWLECPLVAGEGLLLRPFAELDLPRIVEACADEETQRWLTHLPTPYTRSDATEHLHETVEGLANGTGVTWAAVDPGEPDRVLASIGAFRIKPEWEAEVGYWVHPDARGHGVARRATTLAVGHAFETLGVTRVVAYAAAPNTASRRTLEAVGLRQNSTFRQALRLKDGSAVDVVGFDLLAEKWRS